MHADADEDMIDEGLSGAASPQMVIEEEKDQRETPRKHKNSCAGLRNCKRLGEGTFKRCLHLGWAPPVPQDSLSNQLKDRRRSAFLSRRAEARWKSQEKRRNLPQKSQQQGDSSVPLGSALPVPSAKDLDRVFKIWKRYDYLARKAKAQWLEMAERMQSAQVGSQYMGQDALWTLNKY